MPRPDLAGLLTRPNRLTVRTRLTLTYALLFTVAGSVMLALIYIFMRYVPTYAITAVRTADTTDGATRLQTAAPADPAGAATYQPAEGLTSANGTAAFVVSDQAEILNLLLGWSLVVLVLLAAASAWGGWILSGRLLRPLHEINVAAQRAATGSFDHRVALAGPRDEITDLSDTFDHMLERLDRSFRAHRRFAANASHELRTPLATTQAMLDVAATAADLDAETVSGLITRLRETNTRSIQTVEAVLDLADLQHSGLRGESVALGTVVFEACTAAEAAARERGIDWTVEVQDVTVRGDAPMLRQLCANLLQNAVRHNVDDGFVRVTLGCSGGADGDDVVLRVENAGEPIPADVVERLTEPFYRLSGRVAAGPDRSRGLGLAIVESIADVHGAEIDLAARPAGGLVVTVVFPTVRPATGDAEPSAHRAATTRSPRAHTKNPARVKAP